MTYEELFEGRWYGVELAYAYAKEKSTCRCAEMKKGCQDKCDKNIRCDFRQMFDAYMVGVELGLKADL